MNISFRMPLIGALLLSLAPVAQAHQYRSVNQSVEARAGDIYALANGNPASLNSLVGAQGVSSISEGTTCGFTIVSGCAR